MTIGAAIARLRSDRASFLLAADSRYSLRGGTADMAIKTYSLGHQTGAVVAGNALSVSNAIELARGIIDDHDRLTPSMPVSFYSIVRLFSYILDKNERANPASTGCEVVLAGFLENGNPSLAKVVTSPDERTHVVICAPKQSGDLLFMVGQQDAKAQLASAITWAIAGAPHQWTQLVASTIWYLARHEGIRGVGGGVSIALCTRGSDLFWPFVQVENRTFLRGFDFTESAQSITGDSVIRLPYLETWHAAVERHGTVPPITGNERPYLWQERYVDSWVLPSEALDFKVDPDALKVNPDLSAPNLTVLILKPNELPSDA